MSFCEELFDTFHCFGDVVLAGGIAYAEVVACTKCVAADGGYVSFVEEEHGEVVSIADEGVSYFFVEVVVDFGEEVECSLWFVDFEVWYFFASLEDEVAAAEEGLSHVFDVLLCAVVGLFGGFLGDAACSACHLSLEFGACFDDGFVLGG